MPPRAIVVIAAGMAVPQSFYAPFARYLAARGYAAWTFDYRGTGESRRGSTRGAKADLTDWYARDYDAVVNAAADTHRGLPIFAVGHSFGGQSAPLLPSWDLLAGLIKFAVGSGALRQNRPRLRRLAPLMRYVVAPLLCAVFGYFPGKRLGVIGDVPTGTVFQWRRWCLSRDYLLGGEPGAREAYAIAASPVLALTFADDELLFEAGSRMLHAAYARPVDYRVIEPAAFGLRRIGHMGYFRPQSEAMLWPLVTKWIEENGAGGNDEMRR